MHIEAGHIEPGRGPEPSPRPRAAPRTARLRPVVLYCGKCLKRCDDGKALRRALKDGAKARVAETGGRKVRVVETGCLGLCPKGALVAASAATLRGGEAVLLRDEGEVAAALPRLLP